MQGYSKKHNHCSEWVLIVCTLWNKQKSRSHIERLSLRIADFSKTLEKKEDQKSSNPAFHKLNIFFVRFPKEKSMWLHKLNKRTLYNTCRFITNIIIMASTWLVVKAKQNSHTHHLSVFLQHFRNFFHFHFLKINTSHNQYLGKDNLRNDVAIDSWLLRQDTEGQNRKLLQQGYQLASSLLMKIQNLGAYFQSLFILMYSLPSSGGGLHRVGATRSYSLTKSER